MGCAAPRGFFLLGKKDQQATINKMKKKKQPKLKQKKTKNPLRENGTRKMDRLRFKVLTSEFSKVRGDLGIKIRQQADELKIKNVQLRNEAEKQIGSEEQIHVRTQAMEATSDGIFIIDAQKPNFPIIYANQSFQKMTGYAKREILGRNYFLFYGVDADPRIVNEIKHTIRKGKSFYGEMLNFKKNGKKYWNLLRIAPVRDSSGAVTHCVGIQTDLTLMREKELEIVEQREELLHVTRVGKLAEFVSSLAHEIRQPLTAILSYAQAAQRMLAGREPKLQEILQYIINDDQRAAEVIQRLRALLKKSISEMKPVDINALVNETIVLIATDAAVRNSVIKTELDSNLPIARGDRIQLQQVLLNLISNSFDALESSLDPREILIRTSRKNTDTIIVAVKDSGCGIPAQNIPKLFTHFFTSKPDGLGMGLSISRSIVEAHGGQLDVENNPDRGATFYFTIPVDIKDA
jgi:two-component system sensor kinase FixL